MKTQRSSTRVVLLVCFIASAFAGSVGFSSSKDSIRFHVNKDARLTRKVDLTNSLVLVSVEVTIDGKEVQDLGSDVGLRIHREDSHTVHDTFESVAEGHPLRLRRNFETLSSRAVIEVPEQPATEEELYESELEGHDVTFTWDEEEQVFDVAFAVGQTGEDYLLSGLDEDMDLRWLLPLNEVSVEDDWEIEVCKDILSPGGDFRVWDHEQGPDEIALDDALRENRHTKTTATYKGTVVRNGIPAASIQVTVESKSSAESAGSMRIEDSYEVKGELVWDLSRGHMRTISLSGTGQLRILQRRHISGQSWVTVSEFARDVYLGMSIDE